MKEIKAYLENQKLLTSAAMIAMQQDEKLNMVELHYLTGKFVVIDQMLQQFNKEHGTTKKK